MASTCAQFLRRHYPDQVRRVFLRSAVHRPPRALGFIVVPGRSGVKRLGADWPIGEAGGAVHRVAEAFFREGSVADAPDIGVLGDGIEEAAVRSPKFGTETAQGKFERLPVLHSNRNWASNAVLLSVADQARVPRLRNASGVPEYSR